MIQVRELTSEEKDFIERLISVKTLCDVTFHDIDNDMFMIQGYSTSSKVEGCCAYFKDTEGKERAINMAFFGKGKNRDFFAYTMKEPFTLFNAIKGHIRNKGISDIVTRKELQSLAKIFSTKHGARYAETTVDGYRRLLTVCGYLFQKEPGKYIVINNRIPDTLSLKDFQRIGYDTCVLVVKRSKNSFATSKVNKKRLDIAWKKMSDDIHREKYVGLCKIHGKLAVEWLDCAISQGNKLDKINASKKLTENEKVLINIRNYE